MKHLIKISALTLFVFFNLFFYGQKTAIYVDKDALYKQGIELFDKKQYVSAQKNFNAYAAISTAPILRSDALYYAAACGIELFNRDSEWLMREFIEKNPSSIKINSAYVYLARANFRKKKYDETLEYFDKVDIYKLDKDQLAEFYFKRGYSYLQKKNEAKAKADFYEIKDVDNKYAFPANYYYSHIAYNEKNYEIALQGFNRLVGNETFGSVVPYYITQIYFIQGKYEQVVKEAPKLLSDSANIQKSGEINRMIGESYFNLKDFSNALV
jgi:tetratricopeptide (TPR) repeat protein